MSSEKFSVIPPDVAVKSIELGISPIPYPTSTENKNFPDFRPNFIFVVPKSKSVEALPVAPSKSKSLMSIQC